MTHSDAQNPGIGDQQAAVEEVALRQDLATEATHEVSSEEGKAAAIPASSSPAPVSPRGPDPGSILLCIGGGAAAGFLLGLAIDALASKPKKLARSYSPRLPRFSPPPDDPEQVAIRRTAKRHRKNGAEVFADLPGWPKPPKLNGHIPDVLAVYQDREVALEFENKTSVGRTHARRQDVAFSSWSGASPDREYQQVVVKNGRGGRG